MRAPHLNKLAAVLVDYSLEIKSGQVVALNGDPAAMPLLEAIYERLIKAGAHVRFNCQPTALQELFLTYAKDHQLDYVSPLTIEEISTIDARIGIWADTNTKALSNVDPERQSRVSAARQPMMQIFMDRSAAGTLNWCGTVYPTEASAQDAEMSLREYENFVFKAGHLDHHDPIGEWIRIGERQQRVVDYLTGKRELHFQTDAGTDLHVDVEGMTWMNSCGKRNFPDGEVFTGPNLNAANGGVNGVVHYSFPAVHHGREVHDIVLTFENGRVVDATARHNEEFLLKMLDQDDGARNLGEIALGTNYQITRYTRNTLFDEKIGGTFHAAVGAGYPETGNSNQSGLHWDMVCDLREGGTVSVDGEVISRDGKFLFPGWPGTEE
jgi:aminopeptidase